MQEYAERKLGVVKNSLHVLFCELKKKAPNAKIIAFGYPNLFQNNHTSCFSPLLRYPDYQEINWINNVTDSYNIKLAEMAIDNGSYFADIAGEFDNHGSCSAAGGGGAHTFMV